MNYISTRDIGAFRTVIDELQPELGERFPISIENWCGIGHRPYPLPVWNVFLVKEGACVESETIGICSYYRQDADPPQRFWIGWIGVRPKYRRRGRATAMLSKICSDLRARGANRICVYTSNPEAVALYQSIGMSIEGAFAEIGLFQAAAAGDETLLCMSLNQPSRIEQIGLRNNG